MADAGSSGRYCWLVWLLVVLMQCYSLAHANGSGSVHLLEIDGPIGPATRDYVLRGIAEAEQADAALVLVRIDTPGGLDASMRDIIKAMLNAQVPVASWVGPAGARAASAGTYILYASSVAAMAPATHLGAATPVAIGGGGDDGADERGEDSLRRLLDALRENEQPATDAAGKDQGAEGEDSSDRARQPDRRPAPGNASERKAVEDAVATIRALAERFQRNADWAERAVREAATLTASQALEQQVIDLIADDPQSLLAQIDGRTVRTAQGDVVLSTANTVLKEVQPDWRNRLLAVITNPTLAYILLMIGIYGLILEGYNPGALVPGIIGGISLLLALYAFQILPVNYAGLALLILGLALIAAELFVPSFGVLGIGGLISVVIGSVILMDTEVPGFQLPLGLIVGLSLSGGVLFGGLIWLLRRALRMPVVSGRAAMLDEPAHVLEDFVDGQGRVHARGEDWQARSGDSLLAGQSVRVTAIDGLTLVVSAAAKEGEC